MCCFSHSSSAIYQFFVCYVKGPFNTHTVLFWPQCRLNPFLALLVTDIAFLSLIHTHRQLFSFYLEDRQCKERTEYVLSSYWIYGYCFDFSDHLKKMIEVLFIFICMLVYTYIFALIFNFLLCLSWGLVVESKIFLCVYMKILALLNQ